MAKRQNKKDSDLASAIVGLTIAALFAFPNLFRTLTNNAAVILIALCIAISVAAILVIFISSIKSDSHHQSANTRNITRKKQLILQASPWSDLKDYHLDNQTQQLNRIDVESLSNKWSLELIEALEWKCFEDLCANYFKAKGWNAQVTKLGADDGIDIFLYRSRGDLSKPLGIVQCKAWSSSRVGVKSIRELLGIMTDIGCPLGIFITTSSYTPEAEVFAKGKNIKLLDARRIFELIKALPENKQQELLSSTTKGDYLTPSCPSCGLKLVLRTARSGKNSGNNFWGCRQYPKCRYTMPKAKESQILK